MCSECEERVRWEARYGVERLLPVLHHHSSPAGQQNPGGLVRECPVSPSLLGLRWTHVSFLSAGRCCWSLKPRTEFLRKSSVNQCSENISEPRSPSLTPLSDALQRGVVEQLPVGLPHHQRFPDRSGAGAAVFSLLSANHISTGLQSAGRFQPDRGAEVRRRGTPSRSRRYHNIH